METWTRSVLRHRGLLIAGTVAVFVAGGRAAQQLSELLTNRFTLPGTDTERAEKILESEFGQKSAGSFTVVARTDGNAESFLSEVEGASARAAAEIPTGRFADIFALPDAVVSAQIVSRSGHCCFP